MERYGFTTGSPESVGIRSEALIRFLDAVDREKLELHSMLLVRKGKLVFDGFWKPFGPDKLHRLCSAGKAIVAIAILQAVQEGRMKLEDPALDHLPQQAGTRADGRGRRVTVYDLLTMHAGHRADSYGALHASGDMEVEQFFALPFEDEPGTHFFYDNGIPDVLAAMIFFETGMKISEYLRPRLFRPLGIAEVRVEAEGRMDSLPTFCLKTEDLLKLTELLYHQGVYRGTRVLDEALAKQAVSFQVPVSDEREAADPTFGFGVHTRGYGFQIWGNLFGGFILDGGCGQMGIGVPELEMMIAINANDPMAERIVELLWMHLRGNLFARPLPENADTLAALRCRVSSLTCFSEEGDEMPCNVPGGRIRFAQQFLGLEQITLLWEEKGVHLQGANMVTIPTDGRWVNCRMPFHFTEMQSGRGHRRMENGLRLDTHVGYAPSEGYAAAVCQKGSLLLMFRSDAWMGSHLVRFRMEEDGLELTHENGTSYRLRGRENIGNWKNCISRTQVRASYVGE